MQSVDEAAMSVVASVDLGSDELNAPALPGEGFYTARTVPPQFPVDPVFVESSNIVFVMKGITLFLYKTLMKNVQNQTSAGSYESMGFTKSTKDAARNKTWLGVRIASEADGGMSMDDIGNALETNSACNVFIVSELDDSSFFAWVQKDKGTNKVLAELKVISYHSVPSPKSPMLCRDKMVTMCFELLSLGKRYICNYKVSNFSLQGSGSGEDFVREIMRDVRKMTKDEALEEICEAKVKRQNKRNSREQAFAACATEFKSLAGEDEMNAAGSMKRLAAHDAVLGLDSITGWNTLELKTIDVNSGEFIVFDLYKWASEKAVVYTLVMLGSSGVGKTPLAEALCSKLALGLQTAEVDDHYFIKAGTIDSLRKCKSLLRENVPIVFDDVTPGLRRGSRPPMTIDELKKTTTVYAADCTDARNNDIIIPTNCPRIWTSNAMSPDEWFPDLISFHDLEKLTPSQRLSTVSPHVMAIYKRCVFLTIKESIIPSNVRESFGSSSSCEFARKMRLVL